MTAHPRASDWAAERGDRWLAQFPRMERTLHPIDAPLIDALDLGGPLRIAEIGCGAGGTTLELWRRAPAGSAVHAFDVSPSLLAAAQKRAPSNEPGLRFELADVASAKPDAAYDRLVSRFGVMFFDDPLASFQNLVQWLTPGGRFAFAVWGPPADNPWGTLVREVTAAIVAVPPIEPDAPGPFRYANAADFVSLLERAGFADVEAQECRQSLPIGGGLPAADAAEFALAAFSAFADLLRQAGGDALASAQRGLTARYREHEREGGVHMDACVHIVRGTRP